MNETVEAEPDRDLDVAVALTVMGWRGPVQWVDDEDGRDPYAFEPDADQKHVAAGDFNHNRIVPHYSTKRAVAGLVRRHLLSRGIALDVPDDASPEAICRAALEPEGSATVEKR